MQTGWSQDLVPHMWDLILASACLNLYTNTNESVTHIELAIGGKCHKYLCTEIKSARLNYKHSMFFGCYGVPRFQGCVCGPSCMIQAPLKSKQI